MSLQAFPDSKRLRTSTEFDLVFKNNQYRVSTPEFLFLAKENQVKMKRLGMVVAKRNTTRAVDRNCLKRLIREVFRCVELPSLDIVVLTRSRANGRSNSALTDILEQSFGSLSMQFTNHGKVHK
jgi:ribonuclease P protein component